MDIIQEKSVYCSHCGAYNGTKNICDHCHKDIYEKRSYFAYFLQKHTLEKFNSDIEDGIINLLKKYILSHLYGTIMTVAVITAVVSMISSGFATSHITEVSGGVNAFTSSKGPAITLMKKDEYRQVRDAYNHYTTLADKSFGVPYIIEHNQKIEDFIAQETGKFFYYGEHQVMEQGLAAVLPWDDEDMDPGSWYDMGDYLVNEQLTNKLAIKLRDAGYRVTQNNVKYKGFYKCDRQKLSSGGDLGTPDVVRTVEVVSVEIDGKWYIAEDLIFEE